MQEVFPLAGAFPPWPAAHWLPWEACACLPAGRTLKGSPHSPSRHSCLYIELFLPLVLTEENVSDDILSPSRMELASAPGSPWQPSSLRFLILFLITGPFTSLPFTQEGLSYWCPQWVLTEYGFIFKGGKWSLGLAL